MNEELKEKIRPIYEELIGYLSQTPLPEPQHARFYDASFWSPINQSIAELYEITGRDYSKFEINPDQNSDGEYSLSVSVFRLMLGGLINRLYAEYFLHEPKPFSSTPTTVVTQAQSQAQSTQVVVLLEIQERIIEKLHDESISENEKGFLEGVKEGLSDVRNVVGLLNLILSTAVQMGITVDQLSKLFGQ